MCTSPHRVFKTGLKTETGKDLLYFDTHYPCPDVITLERAERQLKRRIPFDPRYMFVENGHIFLDTYLDVPCGKCDSCELQHAKNWAHRCLMEAYYSPYNHFVTLTFRPEVCPTLLDKKDVSGFMKRLRKRLGSKIKFFACGEYGEKTGRPHYHLILFHCRLDDLRVLDASKKLFVSKTIADCWPFGFHSVGEVTPESVNYVARYTSKKSGARKGFLQMSRRPGIGERYMLDHSDAVACDYLPLLVNGKIRRITPPRYFEKLHPEIDFTVLKANRVRNMDASTRVNCYVHNMSSEQFDNYMRSGYYAALRKRLEKVSI